ncbi:MAG: 3-oxoacyl-ACP synthase [Herminiimonas sp.]|nr:3-oxoacyl-ACP synthase [Herminiimonas sp.]
MYPAVRFSIVSHAAWAPGLETEDAWRAWSRSHASLPECGVEPPLAALPPMQRRRLGLLGKMVFEVAFTCLNGRTGVPIVFCSRHGEVGRSVNLLRGLSAGEPLSPTSFALSVHNGIAGLLSIAHGDTANHVAVAGGLSSVEHAVIEACGLLADGEPAVLLIVYDCPLPPEYAPFKEPNEAAFAWAWLMEPAGDDAFGLTWLPLPLQPREPDRENISCGGLDAFRFFMGDQPRMTREAGANAWEWSRRA